MKVLLDTNILLVSLKRNSKFRPIFDNLITSKYQLIISNEILTEYHEIIGSKTTLEIANNLTDLLVRLDNVARVEVQFNWLLLRDPDDNKFVDAAITGKVDFLVSNDNHFR